jgi:uncharacterized protein (TIGR03000 family)
MKRFTLALAAVGLIQASAALAGPFNQGIGGAMYYGPYTGGHAYSWNTAYGYGLSFSPADSWRRDPIAYPAGIYPYRPDGKPILYRTFPDKGKAYVSVPGEDGLPVLVPALPPDAPMEGAPVVVVPPAAAPILQPVPAAAAPILEKPATIRVHVPEAAEVWFDKERMSQTGADRVYQSPPLPPGKTQIYTVRARWTEGGRPVEQFRVVGVRGGETAKLSFPSARP